MKWDFQSDYHPDYSCRAHLDPDNSIRATGDATAPSLLIWFSVEVNTDGHYNGINSHIAHSASLYPSGGTGVAPWSQTGMQGSRVGLYIPLGPTWIERLTRDAEHNSEQATHLWLQLQVLMPTKILIQESRLAQLPSVIPLYTGIMFLPIHLAKWQSFLKVWGYPETRLVPLAMTLPSSLITKIPLANRPWQVVHNALQTAIEAQQKNDFSRAGEELRRAATYAMYTWCVLWGEDEPLTTENAALAQTKLVELIGHCDPSNGTFPKPSALADAKRICARFTILRQLNTLVQAYHHTGERPIYSPDDTEYMVTTMVAFLRTLPNFWEEFPNPINLQKLMKSDMNTPINPDI